MPVLGDKLASEVARRWIKGDVVSSGTVSAVHMATPGIVEMTDAFEDDLISSTAIPSKISGIKITHVCADEFGEISTRDWDACMEAAATATVAVSDSDKNWREMYEAECQKTKKLEERIKGLTGTVEGLKGKIEELESVKFPMKGSW